MMADNRELNLEELDEVYAGTEPIINEINRKIDSLATALEKTNNPEERNQIRKSLEKLKMQLEEYNQISTGRGSR